ncbi:unnamed protein product [Phytomonas sp. EM1]|nr:unnamed protein product [Phytomonas sp. EM1]|eukprot:CCW65010.1 unnamed protein product [Phytomonas sp. isolate EM1]
MGSAKEDDDTSKYSISRDVVSQVARVIGFLIQIKKPTTTILGVQQGKYKEPGSQPTFKRAPNLQDCTS